MNAGEPIQPDRSDPLVPESTGSGTSGIDALDGDWGADGGHLGWRLSALLDGELSVADELRAREHLSGCAVCQDEFTEVMSARAFVRGLGDVEPPQGYVDRVLTRIHRRSQLRIGLVSLVSLAAVWILVLLLGVGLFLPSVDPDVGALASRHAEVAGQPVVDGATPSEVETIGDAAAARIEAPFVLADELNGGYERTAAWRIDDHVVQALYRSDGHAVSVFEQEGSLDWDDLPAFGAEREVNGERVWTATIDSSRGADRHVVVVPEYPLVYTVVSTDSLDAALAVAGRLDEPQAYSWTERLRTNMNTWLDRFA